MKGKNKIILGIIAGILLMGIATAIEEGQTFTQAQVDNFDVDNINWEFLQCTKDGWHVADRSVYVDYSCLIFEQTLEDEYTVFRGDYVFGVSIPQALMCIFNHGIPECQERFRTLARQYALQTVEIIKEQIRDYQTTDGDDIGGWFDNWWLFE